MCGVAVTAGTLSSVYRAPDAIKLASMWGLRTAEREWPSAIGPGDSAPIITRHGVQLAQLGLTPRWGAEPQDDEGLARVAMVDASETPAARSPFERRRWCVIPALAFYLGRSRQVAGGSDLWKFSRKDLQGLSIAGLYDRWRAPSHGREVCRFAILTVDSCEHPLLAEFGRVRARIGIVSSQAPLLIDRAQHQQWLNASTADAMQLAGNGANDELIVEPPPSRSLPRSDGMRGSLVSALEPRQPAGADAMTAISLIPLGISQSR